ncbi:hypothetical protein LOTGIDRAFT_172751 [Lottia gigantea]|uniref:Uncharacterized protein n=1 Tax=Lottia gigantea TaxID=225164 RepID=V4B566_LOTGI|nr:hypothetical protein LOTGIDRAFT_172751 [Lottia gigantea]ESP01122.1 hypothetical protein LOTGIDRAFT_172751 [Lottia gigantea]
MCPMISLFEKYWEQDVILGTLITVDTHIVYMDAARHIPRNINAARQVIRHMDYTPTKHTLIATLIYRKFLRLLTGAIAGIAVSALIGVGILIALIICCTCSKKRHGQIIRTGGNTGPNVTVVSSSMMQQGGMQPAYNYNNYNNQMRGPGFYPQPQPGQPIQQPIQPHNTTQPPSYSQIGQYPTSNQSYDPPPNQGASAPPPYQYTNPAGPQYPASNPSNLINVSPYQN